MTTLEGKRAFLDVIIDKELMVAKALQLGYDEDTQIDAAPGVYQFVCEVPGHESMTGTLIVEG